MYKFGGGARNMDCKVAWVEVTLITNNGENEKYLSSKYLDNLKKSIAQTISILFNLQGYYLLFICYLGNN